MHFGYFADPQAIDILKRWVSWEYVSYQASREDISLSEKVELISQAQTIELKSWSVRGKPERMKTSKSFYKDVMTGLFFITGVLSFMSGQFILSTLLFGAASLASNLNAAIPARI